VITCYSCSISRLILDKLVIGSIIGSNSGTYIGIRKGMVHIMATKTSKAGQTQDTKMRIVSTVPTLSCRAVSMHVLENPIINHRTRMRTLRLGIDIAIPPQYGSIVRNVLTELPYETRFILLRQFSDMVNKTLGELPVSCNDLPGGGTPNLVSINDEERGTEYDQTQDADEEVQILFRDATQLSTKERTKELAKVVTQSLIAYMTRTTERAVRDWISGCAQQPHYEAEKRLLAATTALFILRKAEAPQTIKRWFINSNPNLDDLSPAESIREGNLRSVLRAARAYAVYAY
jgi:hypothetical protein